jgi:hypothetical protein
MGRMLCGPSAQSTSARLRAVHHEICSVATEIICSAHRDAVAVRGWHITYILTFRSCGSARHCHRRDLQAVSSEGARGVYGAWVGWLGWHSLEFTRGLRPPQVIPEWMDARHFSAVKADGFFAELPCAPLALARPMRQCDLIERSMASALENTHASRASSI